MNHSTNIVWRERGELFLHEKALRAYFCTGVHIILARIVRTVSAGEGEEAGLRKVLHAG